MLIDWGEVAGFFYDLETAARAYTRSTGNASRGRGGPPAPAPSALVIAPGDTTQDEMLRDMAARYLDKPPCPRMRDFPRRLAYLSQLISKRRIDGVICSYYKFCDLFMSEYPILRKAMQDLDLPVLLLEDEGEATLSGQHRTRIEAFLEVLR